MKYISYLAFLLFLLVVKTATGQDFKLDSATRLAETGGIPGASATDYYFKISSKVSPSKIKMDSVWVNNKKITLIPKNISITHTKGVTTWRIRIGVHNGKPTGNTIDIKGAAIIYYTYKNKQGAFIVKSITTLPAINYP